jgi:undecaprenyl-diphosphatase
VRVLPTLVGIARVLGTLRWWRDQPSRRGPSGARRSLALAGLAIAGACLVYGVGVFDLPDLDEAVEDTGNALGAWTYVLVGALAFLETGALVGLIVPGETAIIVGGILAGEGTVELVPLIVLVWIAAAAGDTVSFFLGRRLGRSFIVEHGARVAIRPKHVARVEAFFERHGGRAVALGRFIGVIRAIAPFLAGASRMRPSTFLIYDIPSAFVWGTLNIMLGYAVFTSVSAAGEVTKWVTYGLVIAVGIAVVVARARRPARRLARPSEAA